MATLSVTIADDKVPRIQAAFGTTDPITQVRTPATVVQVQAAIKDFLKARTIDYETSVNAIADRATKSGEVY
jgi:hypothetical protein